MEWSGKISEEGEGGYYVEMLCENARNTSQVVPVAVCVNLKECAWYAHKTAVWVVWLEYSKEERQNLGRGQIVFSEPGKVGVMLQRVLRSQSKKFASFSTVSQSGDMRLNHVVYSKYPRPGMTEVIPNRSRSWESLL